MTYKSVHGLALSYMSDLISIYIPTGALRSQNAGLLMVPRFKKKAAGCRAFSYCYLFSGITSQLTSDNLALLTPLNLHSELTSSI